MKMTKREHEQRLTRLADGTSADPDDDRRLVKLYERHGATTDEAPRRGRNARSL